MSGDQDAALRWWRSTRCEAGHCVEVANDHASVLVRDSKDPAGPVLAFAPGAWRAFVGGLRSGAFGTDAAQ